MNKEPNDLAPVERTVSQRTQIISGKVRNPGLYSSVNLNGWILAKEQTPPNHKPILLGYRVDHIPEVWFGIGFRDEKRYWLGPRGRDPHYDELSADDIVIWRDDVDFPFCFEKNNSGTSDYLQWRYILGETERPNANLTGHGQKG